MNAPEDKEGTISRFCAGPRTLEAAVAELKPEDLDAVPPGGGWTIRHIVHHLADGDEIWALAIKMAVGRDNTDFSLAWYGALPQLEWADRWAYGSRSIDVSLSLLKASREHILQLLEHVPEAWNRGVLLHTADGRNERVPVGFIVGMQADHVFHHLGRIQELRGHRGGS